ncbi:MAG: ribulose-phosphate 3-epimerase [Bacilli bacterium]
MEKENLIRPSLLSADFLHLSRDLNEMKKLGISHCHYDVMDGTFVSSVSFGEPLFSQVNAKYGKYITFDVHLMTISPLRQFRQYALIGAKEISFHYEAISNDDLAKIPELRKEFPEVKIGLAISPETDVSLILGIANMFDFFLIMSVVPGKGGQGFIQGSENKIRRLVQARQLNHFNYTIGVDGGINEQTALKCYEAGADFMVCGSYYFKSKDRQSILDGINHTLGLDSRKEGI